MRWFVVSLLMSLTACGMLPMRDGAVPSTALPTSPDSALVRTAAASNPDPASSGFRLMPLGVYALDARIELIRRTRHTLDVQYYLIQDDLTGRLFLRELREAAKRGVRVRLLVDDLYTAGADELFAGLATFENVEVRLFNPFCCARQSIATRFLASLGDVRRLNHRMHNKLLIADGAFAVMGGRNISDEYFARGSASNFVDMDILLAGKVVGSLATIFDSYWNSEQAYPVAAILGSAADPVRAQQNFSRHVDEGLQRREIAVPPTDMLAQRPLAAELDAGWLDLAHGDAVAFADQPSKVAARDDDVARSLSVQMDIMGRVELSTRGVVLSSPYFVPGSEGLRAFADLRRRNVQVAVLTNSLAATDEPAVHVGYARYRIDLLRAGVDLYELSPAGVHRGTWDVIPGLSHGRLHAKVAVIDGASVYIGSMNLDPRSENTNTELGLIVRSPRLAADVTRVLDITRRLSAYRLKLDADSCWRARKTDQPCSLEIDQGWRLAAAAVSVV